MMSDRASRVLAATVAVALNLAVVSVLWRSPSATGVRAAEEIIQIHWIQLTSKSTRELMLTNVRAPAAIPNTITAASTPLKAVKIRAPQPNMVLENDSMDIPAPDSRLTGSTTRASQASPPIFVVEGDSWDAASASKARALAPVVSKGLFPPEKISFQERQTPVTFTMQDSSVMAKLDRLSVATVCNRLRMLALGSDLQLQEHRTSREVILRTMQNEKCRL